MLTSISRSINRTHFGIPFVHRKISNQDVSVLGQTNILFWPKPPAFHIAHLAISQHSPKEDMKFTSPVQIPQTSTRTHGNRKTWVQLHSYSVLVTKSCPISSAHSIIIESKAPDNSVANHYHYCTNHPDIVITLSTVTPHLPDSQLLKEDLQSLRPFHSIYTHWDSHRPSQPTSSPFVL